MTALTVEADRALTGGQARRLPVEINANPFVGSALSFAADGYVHELVSGEVFAGFCTETIQTKDAATADGSRFVEVKAGAFVALLTISGVAIDDVQHRRKVYASDDNTFAMAGSGTLIGEVIGLDSSGKAIVLCESDGYTKDGFAGAGIVTHAATGTLTITTAMLGKLNLIPSTGAQTANLPAAADCTGRTLTFKKTTTDAVALTLDGASSETIDGATTNAVMDAENDTLTIISTGTAWVIIAAKIA